MHFEWHQNRNQQWHINRVTRDGEGKSGAFAIVHILLSFPYVQCATNQRITQVIKNTVNTNERQRAREQEREETCIDRDTKHATIECGRFIMMAFVDFITCAQINPEQTIHERIDI